MFCNRQAESSPFTDATRCFADLVKLIENGPMFFAGDADAGIADCDFEEAIIRQRFDPHASAVFGELDGIAEEVVKDLFHSQAISKDGGVG